MTTWHFNTEQLEKELTRLLRTLAEEYPLSEKEGEQTLTFCKSQEPGVLEVHGNTITYGDLPCAARGLSAVMGGESGTFRRLFPKLGVMFDCSRNGVMTVDAVCRWLRRLALMGYNQVMLYTETTYRLPGEPYFGYLNGAYTMEELRKIDDYAAKLGIEVIGCIQVLGHLHNLLKWFGAYGSIRDTDAVLKIDQPETYRLIGKMLDFWKGALRSRRIHIGMDETFGVGLGAYLREHGYVPGFELFNRHLEKVNAMCLERGLNPMIWSDMYFRLGSVTHDYYDREARIPDAVREKIPRNVELVYWDYYHTDKAFYLDWIERHRALGFEPVMASGIWTWTKLWQEHRATKNTVKPCIEACCESGLREVIFTMWGDDGAACDLDSALAGLLLASDWSFGKEEEPESLEKRFRTMTGGASYRNCVLASGIEYYTDAPKPILFGSHYLLWDDPLLGIAWNNYLTMNPDFPAELEEVYQTLRSQLESCRNDNHAPSMDHAFLLADVLTKKLILRNRLVRGYRSDNRAMLREALALIPETLEACRRLSASFRRVWLRNYKPFGLEVIQIRQAGLIARLEECATVLSDYLDGKTDSIPQLEELPATRQDCGHGGYRYWATASTVF